MAYNPFDDVIEQDPAYMQTSGRSVIPQRRVNYDQETFKPVASAIAKGYSLLTPEQDTLDEIEKNKQLRSLSTAQALKGTQFEEYAGQADLPSFVVQSPGIKERLDAAGYKPQGFIEGMSRIGQFFYGDQRRAFDKLAQGQQLTDQDRTSIALAPLDSLDFLFPPIALKKLAGIGLKTVDDVLKSTSDLEEVKQLKNYFGGQGFTPAGVVRAPDTGGTSGRPGVSVTQQKRLDEQKKETLKLADILKKDLDEDKNLTIRQLIEKYNLQGITLKGRQDLKNTSRDILNEEVPELFKARTAQSQKNIGFQKGKVGDEQLLEYLKKKRESGEKFESFTKIADDLVALKETVPGLKVVNRKSLTKRYNENPEFAELFDEIIDRPEKIQDATDRFQEAYNKIPLDNKLKLLGEETIKDINPDMFNSITRLSSDLGKSGVIGPDKLFKQFLYDKYRSIKESNNPQGIVTEDDFFQKIKFTDKDITNLKNEFSDYVMLERDRLYMQKEGLNFMNRLLENPQFKPYLINPNTGKVDQKLFTVNKLHDVPLFEARKEGKGRLKKVGRFLNTGTDPEFLNPHFQPYNRLMVDLDPTLNKLADFLNQKGLMNEASKMDAQVIPKIKDKEGNLQTPKSRINFITEGIVNLINNKGFNLDPTGKKQDVFLKEVAEAIDDIYKERGLRAVVPTLKGAKNETQIFGVENPKAIDLDTKIDQYKEALTNALNYAVENNISPEDFRTKPKREKGLGYIKSLKRGGPVKMAIGGDPLTNINQQQFADDPAFQGQDFFKQAVESGNLQAFNPINIFKGLGKVKAMLTPNKVTDVPTMPKATDPIEDFTVPPPMKPKVNPGDFPFQSYLLGAITDPNAPKNAAPNEWMNFLAKGKNVSESELNDSGISAYLEDSIKFLPGQKVSQETLVNVFEKSPIANIEIFVKKSDVPDRPDTDRDVVNFNSLQGRPEHKGAGNVRIDEAGENYREILINAPELPGQKEPYFNTSHYSKEPNILAFARVADYKNVQGDDVAVIQELQTDYLTKLKKEQERLGALVQNIENKKRFLQEKLMRDPTDAYFGDQLRALETQYPNARVEFLKNTNLTKPSKPLILETMAPDIQSNLAEFQTKIQAIANQNKFQVVDPNYQNKIVDLQVQGREQFNKLFELNRQQNFDDQLKDVFVTSESQSDDILRSAQDQDLPAQYRGKKLETFPSIPFNKGPDWIDMMLKATIQDARSNGINKIAIMPSEFVNMRWNKDPSGPAAEKFKTIYDKIAVQQMKNIAKKYGGNVEIEQVIDKTKGKFGYKYINKGAGGEEILDTTDDLDKTVIKPKDYFDARIMKELKTYGDNSILLRREIAPNQFSEFIVRPDDERTTIGYKLETPPDDFNEDNIIRIIQEYNPSETPMFVLTLPEETSKQGPMFLFRKKDGGKIASDGLVSITDIYGEYNGRKV